MAKIEELAIGRYLTRAWDDYTAIRCYMKLQEYNKSHSGRMS